MNGRADTSRRKGRRTLDRIPVKTEQGVFEAEKGEDLLRFLHRIGISVPSDCGGAGTCGKCTVDIVQGGTVFRVKACSYRIREEIAVLAAGKGEGQIRTANRTGDLPAGKDLAAVDLGTTAVSAVLCRGGRIYERTERNCLSVYGSDVISRAGAIRERGELDRAAGMLRDQLYGMISRLCGEAGCPLPGKVTVGGNTVMEHILAGRDPFPITVYPFEPQTLFRAGDRNVPLAERTCAELMPCVSGYFGGDLTAGLYYLKNRMREGEKALFIDIGTNGEMALWTEDGITCCSVACGPAFEGGNISCGMTGTDGAVDHAFLEEGEIRYTVIGGGAPKGICGSGILDLVAALLSAGMVDETGRFLPPEESGVSMKGYGEDGDGNGILRLGEEVFVTAADIRSIQMAKAAVAAGISVLLAEQGAGEDGIGSVYLAGGFGTLMDPESAVRIGMIPEALRDRCVACGNTCLKGAALAASSEEAERELSEICGQCRYIELSTYGDFNELYIENMAFGG